VCFGDRIDIDTDLAALSLIGEGLNRNNLTLLETLDLLAQNKISVSGITTTSYGGLVRLWCDFSATSGER